MALRTLLCGCAQPSIARHKTPLLECVGSALLEDLPGLCHISSNLYAIPSGQVKAFLRHLSLTVLHCSRAEVYGVVELFA